LISKQKFRINELEQSKAEASAEFKVLTQRKEEADRTLMEQRKLNNEKDSTIVNLQEKVEGQDKLYTKLQLSFGQIEVELDDVTSRKNILQANVEV
jgi:hypothetical protein